MPIWAQNLLVAGAALASLGWLFARSRRRKSVGACGCEECPAAKKLLEAIERPRRVP